MKKNKSLKREWPGVHVRVHPDAYKLLQQVAEKDSRSLASMATLILDSGILAMAIKHDVERGRHGAA